MSFETMIRISAVVLGSLPSIILLGLVIGGIL